MGKQFTTTYGIIYYLKPLFLTPSFTEVFVFRPIKLATTVFTGEVLVQGYAGGVVTEFQENTRDRIPPLDLFHLRRLQYIT